MDTVATEDLRFRLTSLVEVCRTRYLRIKDAGNYVTPGEKAEVRTAYQSALERLNPFLADTRRPPSDNLTVRIR
jgi:hypothetical protein